MIDRQEWMIVGLISEQPIYQEMPTTKRVDVYRPPVESISKRPIYQEMPTIKPVGVHHYGNRIVSSSGYDDIGESV